MSNPFESNPWQSSNTGGGGSGPIYGNAYDNEPTNGYSSYNNNNTAYNPSATYNSQFSTTGYNNAWGDESNKTQYDHNHAYNQQQPSAYGQPPQSSSFLSPQQQPAYASPSPQIQSPYATHQQAPPSPIGPAGGDAYQFAGTRYGNQPPAAAASAYSNIPAASPPPDKSTHHAATTATETTTSVGPDPWNGEVYHTPNRYRFWLRFVVLITSIGHLGFAAGAQPYSHEKPPFSTTACFYYLFAVAAASIVWAFYHVMFYCYRRLFKKQKMNRPIMLAIDLLFAVLWGIGIIVEIAKFRCGLTGKFCAFYNVSIFWGFVAFVAYIVCSVWDLYGGCCTRRRK